MKAKIAITGFVVISVLICVVYFYTSKEPEGAKNPSNEDFLSAITREFPVFIHDNNPVIKVSNVSNPESGWYVVNIQSAHEEESLVPVRVILRAHINNTLYIVAGPENHFEESEMIGLNLPDSVIMELQK